MKVKYAHLDYSKILLLHGVYMEADTGHFIPCLSYAAHPRVWLQTLQTKGILGREEVGRHLRKPTGSFSSVAEPCTPHDLKNNSAVQSTGTGCPFVQWGQLSSQLCGQLGDGLHLSLLNCWLRQVAVKQQATAWHCTVVPPMRQKELMGDFHPRCSSSGIR